MKKNIKTIMKLSINRFDDLQTLMGDAYKEGITIDEINSFLSNKKLADLSTGNYVDKNKYDADIKAKDGQIKNYKDTLNAKLTDDEKAKEAEVEKDKLIESLRSQIKANSIATSKSTAEAILANTKKSLGIKDDDTAFGDFINSISGENVDGTKALATYINKLVTDSYEKGKKEATRNELGTFSNGVQTSSGNDDKKKSFGAELAKLNKVGEVDSELYFKKN